MTGAERARASVVVTGVVQAVGFRPFVYRTAVAHDLAGSVKNLGDAGVTITVEGHERDVESFLSTLRTDHPPLARVDSVEVSWEVPRGVTDFGIEASEAADRGSGSIPPDTGICESCLEDVRDPDSRYHDYWATACVDCGPRFTVVRELPYDRERTSMDAYPLCETCRGAYEDPADRRYHAQTTACPDCGPSMRLVTPDGEPLADGPSAIEAAMARVSRGEVVGIKGTGGTHLACDASDVAAVERLRERLGRSAKPFALMAPDVETIESFAHVGDREREILTDVRRPIVALEKRERAWLESVSPGLHTVGVMLPYAGLHHLLFDHAEGPLVVTSANLPGVPMATVTDELLAIDAIDAALVHDREIVARCDDSVVRVVDGTPTFLRRSRGWVPEALPAPRSGPTILAMGGEFDATVAVSRGEEIVPSQHVGDVDGPDALDAHRTATDHLCRLLGLDPDAVACDVHPDFLTTAEAHRRAGETEPIRVQHHHAHAVGLLGEHERERGVVITLDGTGYGPDGTVWGGEVLLVDHANFERVGGLAPFGLPGGEQAVRYPARILASLLSGEAEIDRLLVDRGIGEGATTERMAAQVRRQIETGVNCPATTSAGRYLDAVAALLDVCTERTYEGRPAMELEAVAARGDPIGIEIPESSVDGRRCLDTSALVRQLASLAESETTADVAATALAVLAEGVAEIAIEAAAERDLPVGISGGVAVNDAIVRTVHQRVADAGVEFLSHDLLPPGDGGLAYGQALVALARQ